jgi:Protein of unknown function (DUF3168)
MTYSLAAGLQTAVYQRLIGDSELASLVGGAIYDAPLQAPLGEAALEHITLGEEIVRPNNTKTSSGVIHDFDVTVHSGRDSFEMVKRIAGAVCAALVDAPLTVERGRLVALRFLRAAAVRSRAPEKRRVALRFRAVLDADE